MNHRSSQVSRGASRRSFLVHALAITPLAPRPARARPHDRERERLACILATYGSEIGDLRRIEGRE